MRGKLERKDYKGRSKNLTRKGKNGMLHKKKKGFLIKEADCKTYEKENGIIFLKSRNAIKLFAIT